MCSFTCGGNCLQGATLVTGQKIAKITNVFKDDCQTSIRIKAHSSDILVNLLVSLDSAKSFTNEWWLKARCDSEVESRVVY